MKKWIALCLVLLMIPAMALADTVADLVPDTAAWGVSRTKFKDTYSDVKFDETAVGDYNALLIPGLEVDACSMDAYYVFSAKQKSYYGFSEVAYLLSGTKKISDAELKKVYGALLTDMTNTFGKPGESGSGEARWYYDDCTIELAIGALRDYNGSRNKTVALRFIAPDAGTQNVQPTATPKANSRARTKTKTMAVTAAATCGNYNHVGNAWTQAFYVNGKKLGKSSSVELTAGDEITVRATITDNDSSPDSGTNSQTYTVTQSDLNDGFSLSFYVNVTENKGRYKDSTAKWRVTFKFE